jgi:hypothetical protein
MRFMQKYNGLQIMNLLLQNNMFLDMNKVNQIHKIYHIKGWQNVLQKSQIESVYSEVS